MSIKTVNIKGKQYAMVHDRVNHFRSQDKYLGLGIETELLHFDQQHGYCVVRAIIKNDVGQIVASGLAHEYRDDDKSKVNKTSFVENAETSAIGRALACLGIGTEDAYASAFEVQNAIAQSNTQPSPQPPPKPSAGPATSVGSQITELLKAKATSGATPDDLYDALFKSYNDVFEVMSVINALKSSKNLNDLKDRWELVTPQVRDLSNVEQADISLYKDSLKKKLSS